MAGIGFELRRLLRKNTLIGLVEAYAYAGIIGSGPWVFSIVGILLIGLFSASLVVPSFLVTQFQTSVTYLVAGSLILTGLVQLAFTRFVSDRLFEKKREQVLPNLHGLLLIVILAASLLGSLLLFIALPGPRHRPVPAFIRSTDHVRTRTNGIPAILVRRQPVCRRKVHGPQSSADPHADAGDDRPARHPQRPPGRARAVLPLGRAGSG